MWGEVVLVLTLVAAITPYRESRIDREVNEETEDMMRSLLLVKLSHRNDQMIYKSRLDFKAGIMKPLYVMAPGYIHAITDRQPFPKGFVTVKNKKPKILPIEKNKKILKKHYSGTMSALYGLLALGVIIVIIGLVAIALHFVFAGKDMDFGTFLHVVISIILFVLLGLFLSGAIFAQINEARVVSGLDEVPQVLQNALDDAVLFLDDIRQDVQHSLITNYNELMSQITPVISKLGSITEVVVGKITGKSSAQKPSSFTASMVNVYRMLAELETIRNDLHVIQELTASLRLNSDHLNAGLRKTKEELLETLAICQQPQCSQLLKTKLKQLDIEINYTQLPDVSGVLSNVTQILDSNVTTELSSCQQAHRESKLQLIDDVERSSPLLKSVLDSTGEKLRDATNKVNKATDDAIKMIQNKSSNIQQYRDTREQYESQRRMGAVGAPLAVFMITILLVAGIVTAWFNHMIGVWLLFAGLILVCFLSTIVLLVTGGFLAIGVGAQCVICDPILKPKIGNRMWDVIEEIVDIERMLYKTKADPGFTLARTLRRCHRNMTMYNVLDIHRMINIEKIQQEVLDELKKTLNKMANVESSEDKQNASSVEESDSKSNINEGDDEKGVTAEGGFRPVPGGGNDGEPLWRRTGRYKKQPLLSPYAEQQLLALADIGDVDSDLDVVPFALETRVKELTLSSLASQLTAAADSLLVLRRPQPEQVATRLREIGTKLRRLDRDVVSTINKDSATLNATAHRVQLWLRDNSTSFRSQVLNVVSGAVKAGYNIVAGVTVNLVAKAFTDMLMGYLDRMVKKAQQETGPCAPMSNVINVTMLSVCQNILLPHHGFWLSLAWCSFLLLPIVALVAALLLLYRTSDSDGGGGGFSFSFSLPSFGLGGFLDLFRGWGTGRREKKERKTKGLEPCDDYKYSGVGSEGVSCPCPSNPLVLAVSVQKSTKPARCPCLLQPNAPAHDPDSVTLPSPSPVLPNPTSAKPERPYLVPR